MEIFACDSESQNQLDEFLEPKEVEEFLDKIEIKASNIKDQRECPICLQELNSKKPIVRLKCSKFHIYHRECLEV